MHVSAVICTRNRPDLIGSAVASVLANTYPDFDLLVVDQSDDERTGQVAGALESEPDADMLYGQVLLPSALVGAEGEVPTLPIDRPQRLSHRDGFRIYGMGANFGARRRLFERVGGFDEILGGGGPLKSSQDFDFQYRAYLGGATVLLRPDVQVDHYGVRTH